MIIPAGTRLTVVSNKHNWQWAAYRRFERGKKDVYVCLASVPKGYTTMKLLLPSGRLHNYYYDVLTEDVFPEGLLDKPLEEYL